MAFVANLSSEVVATGKAAYLLDFVAQEIPFLMKLSKLNKKKGDKRGHVSTEAKAAAAGPPPFSPRWGISKINHNSKSSCLIESGSN